MVLILDTDTTDHKFLFFLCYAQRMMNVSTSLGEMCPRTCVSGLTEMVTVWKPWFADSTPEVDVMVPVGGEDLVTSLTLCLQLQAVPKWALKMKRGHEYKNGSYVVSVPLDRVEDVGLEKESPQGPSQYRVRVGSTVNLFNEILLRGAVGSEYAIRLFSVASTGATGVFNSGYRGHKLCKVSRAVPRVFIIEGSKSKNADPAAAAAASAAASSRPAHHHPRLNIHLSNMCMITSFARGVGQCDSEPSLHSGTTTSIHHTMSCSALAKMKDSIADELAAAMAKTLRVMHARLPRSVLLSIADYTTPRLFHNHGWMVNNTSDLTFDAMTDCVVVLNSNGFPAFCAIPPPPVQ